MSLPQSYSPELNLQLLKPAFRAFVLGYLTTTGPRIVSFLAALRRRDLSYEQKARQVFRIFGSALRWDRFPAFCALLAGGTCVLPALTASILKAVFNGHRSKKPLQLSPQLLRLVRFISIFISALTCFQILNRKGRPESKLLKSSNVEQATRQNAPDGSLDKPTADTTTRPELAGRTLDLSLFAATRSVDLIVNFAWARLKRSKHIPTRFQPIIPVVADTGVFATSAAIVMWAWFYVPERLPSAYSKWISEAAQVDSRLIEALRTARRGDWTYGRNKGDRIVLEEMCDDYGWPRVWGDTSRTIPIPCEMVHMGCGPNCEKHAIWRFITAFKFAASTYLPLQVALRWRSRSVAAYIAAIKSAIRSSTFLGLFVSLFYYSVCLARTRLGPKLISAKRVSPMMWDSGLCVGAGCLMCGWSIFVESAQKRQEIALFVAPRAAAAIFPRQYDRKYLWRENLMFSLSTAIILSCIHEDPTMVRGVLGRLLHRVFRISDSKRSIDLPLL
ncbi:hypothetical protein FQN57_005107 [Myotisia sp. PD_48]|nr:hypothetical protein FQN57_005107 [Myotisia sp. PD_48]